MSIQVNDFQWEPGKNDAEYIKLLESSRNEWQTIAQKAIAKLKALSKAQEPVEPKVIDTSNSKLYRNDMFKNYYCGNCGEFLHVVNRRDMFCSQCGRVVKWE